MNTACILAAGMGERLGPAGTLTPKALLRVGGRPIIEASLERLAQAGIGRVILVTGDVAEQLDSIPRVERVHNARFHESGSMYSLYLARHLLTDDFLLLESDLVYEQRALDALLNQRHRDAILISGPTNAGDEVFVATKDGMLVDMSKQLEGEPTGELVGITRVTHALLDAMVAYAENRFRDTLHVAYETDALVACARSGRSIACPLVPDLLWCEIDTLAHLRRAETIQAEIAAKEQA